MLGGILQSQSATGVYIRGRGGAEAFAPVLVGKRLGEGRAAAFSARQAAELVVTMPKRLLPGADV
jgi:hypothetical protein